MIVSLIFGGVRCALEILVEENGLQSVISYHDRMRYFYCSTPIATAPTLLQLISYHDCIFYFQPGMHAGAQEIPVEWARLSCDEPFIYHEPSLKMIYHVQ